MRFHVLASAAQHWSSTPGKVAASYVRKTETAKADQGGAPPEYLPIVRYQYQVGADRFTGSRIGFGDMFHDRDSAHGRARAYPTGSTVMVFFDPRDPSSSVLDKTYPSAAIALLAGLASLFALVAAFLPRLVRLVAKGKIPA